MAAPRLGDLGAVARATGYQPDTLEVVARLLDLLQAIAHDPDLGGRVALMGGTALNGFHSSWPRLSLDIDLTYMGAPEWDAALAARPVCDSALRRILADRGYRISREPGGIAGGKWAIGFDAHLAGGAQGLEIDLGYVERRPLFTPVRMSSAPLGGRVAGDMLVFDKREIVAGKMTALFKRGKLRDIFDAVEILSDESLDWRDIKAAFLARIAASRGDPRDMTVDSIQPDPREPRENLERCLPAGFFSGTTVERWIEEAVGRCRRGFAHLVDWNGREREFLEDVWGRGEINSHLLDCSTGLQAGIALMPHLHWRREKVLAGMEREAREREAPERDAPERDAPEKGTQRFSVRRRPSGRSIGL